MSCGCGCGCNKNCSKYSGCINSLDFFMTIKWVASWENLFMPYANNKSADQPAHSRSLISTFVVLCLESIIPVLAISKNSRLASFWSRAGRFESDLVTNPEDRFSGDEAQMQWHRHICTIVLSFSFQAFSVFFVSIAITSDVVCYLFIPIQWLFFAASTYVWVQYVWHTGKLHILSSVVWVC